jgi:ubiquinone/menaquinone biosynthesis C-methylase UbiE
VAGWKDKRKVMQRYDLTAQMYEERYAEEQKTKYMASLENLNVAGCTVLDVGCGSGLFFNQVANQASLVVGVDISRKLLLKAKERAGFFENVSVLQADADHLPIKESAFDIVFAFTVLQNMPKPTETLSQLKCPAKVGGNVVVSGLKKAFPLPSFMEVLEGSGLTVVSFVDREDLKCYVAVLAA